MPEVTNTLTLGMMTSYLWLQIPWLLVWWHHACSYNYLDSWYSDFTLVVRYPYSLYNDIVLVVTNKYPDSVQRHHACVCRYPDSWYDDITSSSRFYSLAATHQSRIIGLIVAELKPKSKLNKEVSAHLLSLSVCLSPLPLTAPPSPLSMDGWGTYFVDFLLTRKLKEKEKWVCILISVPQSG